MNSGIEDRASFPWYYWPGLYVLVILFPLLTGLGFIRQIAEERFKPKRRLAEQELKKLGPRIAEKMNPRAFRDFISQTMILSEPRRTNVLRRFHRQFPSTLMLFTWNKKGERLPGLPEFQFHNAEAIPEMARRFLHLGRLARGKWVGYQDNLEDFQKFLGSAISIESFLKSHGETMEVLWHNVPAYFNWMSIFPPETIDSPDFPLDAIHGYFACLLYEKVPQEFFFRIAQTKQAKSDFFRVILDLNEPRKSVVQKGFSQTVSFARKIRAAYDKRENGILSFENFIGAQVADDPQGKKLYLLLRDILPLLTEEKEFWSLVESGVHLVLLLSGILFVLLWRGLGEYITVRWRVMGLLSMAVFLPFSGVYWVGTAMVKELETRDQTKAFDKLRQIGFYLPQRFEKFVTWYNVALKASFLPRLEKCTNEAELMNLLSAHQQRQEGRILPNIISHFFLSDEKGHLSHSSLGGKKIEIIGYKIFLKKAFQLMVGESGAGSLFGETLIEEYGAGGSSRLASNQKNPLPGIISKVKMGRGVAYLLPLAVSLGGKKRILVLQFSNGLLEQNFFRFEMRHGALAKIKRELRGTIDFFFFELDINYQTFDQSPILRNPKAYAPLDRHQEMTGEFRADGKPFLFFSGPKSLYDQYRYFSVIDQRELLAGSDRRRTIFHLGFFLFLLVTLLIGFFLTTQMLEPIHLLDGALGRVRAGDLQVLLPPMGSDEIGRLSGNFNRMTAELREKERMQAYLSEAVLQAVKQNSMAAGHEAKRMEISILFSDIRGFTTLSEQFPPDQMFQMLNEYFETVESCLRSYGGQVQKFIGDAVYAVFPEEGAVGALHAVQAACAITAFLKEFNQGRQERGLFTIQIGIGVHTGLVLLGKVGSEKRMDFAYVGDAIQIASSLEAASKHGRHSKIMISGSTRRLVGDRFQADAASVPDVEMGGQEVYEIICPGPESVSS